MLKIHKNNLQILTKRIKNSVSKTPQIDSKLKAKCAFWRREFRSQEATREKVLLFHVPTNVASATGIEKAFPSRS